MSILNESATELYNRLILELSTKAKKSLELVKKSCDDIELARGVINYSKVAEFATKHYGGPSKQTVQNINTEHSSNFNRFFTTIFIAQ